MKFISFLIKLPILKRIVPSIIRNIFIFFRYENFIIKFKGIKLETNIRDPHDREVFFTQKYEEKQFQKIEDIIKQNKIDIFIDVGANSGIYSLILSKKFNDLKIYALEPIKETYQKFLRNIILNKLEKKIFHYNLGLSNKEEVLKMKTKVKFGYSQSAGYHVSKDGIEEAKFKIGDNLLDHNNMRICIKIDTEGHEQFVLEGLTKLIDNNNIFLQIEIWDKNLNNVKILLKKLNFTFIEKVNNDYYFKKTNR